LCSCWGKVLEVHKVITIIDTIKGFSLKKESDIPQVNYYIKEVSASRDKISVLDAGCGPRSVPVFDFGEQSHITGIDISSDQLAKNRAAHEKILGDIQTINLPASSFDIVLCWDVLEHLPHPEMALNNFVRTLKDGGIAIIRVPNMMSLKGLITKFTPYSFHLWIFKHVFVGRKNAPRPTYLRWILSPQSLNKFAKANNLSILLFHPYDTWTNTLVNKSLVLCAIYLGLGLVMKILTLGKISITKTDCVFVYRKK